MSKKVISIFFSVTFLLFMTVPTIILLVDDTTDVSIFFSISEEEEKESEKDLDVEVLFYNMKFKSDYLTFKTKENNLESFYSKYTNPYLNKVFPPPELHLL